jgi:hypothetical protein
MREHRGFDVRAKGESWAATQEVFHHVCQVGVRPT